MQLSLKEDYITRQLESLYRVYSVTRVKKGAPITVHLGFSGLVKGHVSGTFAFYGGMLTQLLLKDLVLPDKCSRDEGGDIICVKEERFFFISLANSNSDLISAQIKRCPICGSELVNLSPSIPKSDEGKYVVKTERTKETLVPFESTGSGL